MIDNSEELARWRADDGDNTLLINHPLTKVSTVYEIGGYKGDWAKKISDKYGCYLKIFEPNRMNYNELIRKLNGDKIRCRNVALGGYERNVPFGGEEDSFSAYNQAERLITVLRIGDMLARDAFIDLMNINIEGMEYEVLIDLLVSDLIGRIGIIQVQFHPWTDNALIKRDIIRKWLSYTHDCVYCYEWVWECWKIKNNGSNL